MTGAPALLLMLAIACRGCAAGWAAAPVNLLPQGDFKNPGAHTGWAEGFNLPGNQEYRVITENGKSWLRLENHDARRQLDYVHAYVRLTPEIESLAVSVRLKTTALKVGAQGWHDARVAMSFEDGPSRYPAQVPHLAADSDWVTQSVELKVPQGATRLNIQPAMFYCTGIFEIADLVVTPRMTVTTPLADAALPPGMTLNWEITNVVEVSSKRAQASLDGVWRFLPQPKAPPPPEAGWAYLKVPGSWQNARGRSGDFVARGGGPQWEGYDGGRISRAWYERQVPIPAAWQGRVISLRFDRVCTDAIVYVNGAECGRIAWPWGSVDITSAFTPRPRESSFGPLAARLGK